MSYEDSVISLIKDNNYKEVAEIGIFRGILARQVLTRCHLWRYYMVDPWIPYSGEGAGYLATITSGSWNDICLGIYSEFQEYPIVRIIRLDSVRAATLFEPESLDMVFIDADHTYEHEKEDIGAWFPIVRVGGILSGHDYGSYPGVVKVVDERFPKRQLLPGLVWYVEKI